MAVKANGGPLEFDAVIYMQQFQQQLNTIERGLQGITNTANKEAKSIENLVARTTGAIAAYASFSALGNFVGDIARVRGEFQQLEVAFTTMLGNKQKADALLVQIKELAATTPFELKDVATGAKQLLAYGFAAENITDELRMLGDIAAGVGTDIAGLVYLYGTLKTSGRVTIIDLQQFAGRGIPIFQELSKQLGISVSQIRSMVSEGKIGFEQVQKAFQNLTAEGGMFNNLMEQQSKTITGLQSNLADAWNQMLNNIGQSTEGIMSDTIRGAITIVENYETVLDVLKVLVITYGTYKAAVITTNVVTAISTTLTKGYTIAETLRYQAMLLSERAMKLLNATMLRNPAVLVATGVAALVAALVVFRRESSLAKSQTELLSQAQENMGDRFAETRAKIQPYIDALKKANLTEEEKLTIYNKLKEIDPKIVDGINAKTIAYDKLKVNLDAYLGSLRNQIALETNRSALVLSIQNEQNLQKKLDKAKADVDKYNKALADINANVESGAGQGTRGVMMALREAKNDVEKYTKALDEQKKTTEQLGATQVATETKTTAAKKRTVEVIDEEIKSLKDKQQKESTSAKEYQEFQTKINALEAERKAIVGETKKEVQALRNEEGKLNSILRERADILSFIKDLQKEAKSTGLEKEQAELDRINKKYDEAIEKVDKFNKSVDQFNKANKTNVQKIGLAQINAINDARNTEIKNFNTKLDVEKYRETLDKQRAIFEQYEEAKKQIGIEKANELFAAQTEGFESYIEYLNQQAGTLAIKSQLGIANDADKAKFKLLVKEITEFENKSEADRLKARINNIARVFQETATFNQRMAALDRQYEEDLKTLRTEFAGEELEKQIANLRKRYGAEREALENSMITQSELYQKLNQDILGFSRDRIRQEIEILKKQLKVGTFTDANGQQQVISPAFRKQVEEYIKSLNDVLRTTSELAKDGGKLQQIAEKISMASQEALALADAFDGVNDGIAQTMREISGVADIASNALASVGQFMSGDIAGGIQSAIKAITGVIRKVKEIADSFEKTKETIAEFNQAILFGEIDINIQYRERLAMQASLNKLRLEGIRDERAALEQSKQANADEYNRILQLLQAESFVSSTKQKTKNTFLSLITGFGKKSEVEKELSSLAGKSFEEIEKLFATGQLTDKAKQLFEQLRELRDEGVNIDQMLEENKKKAQEMFTGTTADSLVDTIANGFASGLRSASDFATTFEELMRNAMINSLKFQYLEGPLQEFFEQFADATQSDSQLTQSEIDALKQMYNTIITNADQQFQQLQQIAGINVNGAAGSGNALAGAIKGMTEETAQLLAGQFGGLRITAIEQLNVSKQGLIAQQKIEINTALTVARLEQQTNSMYQWFMVQGIKVQ